MRFAFFYVLVCALVWSIFYVIWTPFAIELVTFALRESQAFFVNFNFARRLLVALALSLIIELLFVGWERSSIKKVLHPSPSTVRDVIPCLLFMFGILDLISFFLLFGVPYFLGHGLKDFFPVLKQLAFISKIDSIFLRAVVGVILVDFFLYTGHWLLHRFGLLWETHKYHHAAEEMTVFNAHRNDFFSRPLRNIVSAIPLVFFGARLGEVFLVALLFDICIFISHSAIDKDWGWLGRWVFVSPKYHRLHHSANPEHYGHNLGFVLVFWDRLFGTYKAPCAIPELGLGREFNNAPLFAEMFSSVKRIKTMLFKH